MTETITLRKAAMLRDKIAAHIATISTRTEVSMPVESAKSVKIFSDDQTELLLANLARYTLLTDILYGLREKIRIAMDTAGIDPLVTKQRHLKAKRLLLQTLARQTPRDDDLAASKQKNTLQQLQTGHAYGVHDIKVSLATQVMLNDWADQLLAIERESEKLKDQLAELNTRSTVKIEANTMETLRKERLI